MSNNIPDSILSPNVTTPAPEVTKVPENVTIAAPVDKLSKEPEELTSTRWAHLSKKESALQKERESFKKELEAYKKEKEERSSEYEKYRKSWEMVNEIAELQKTNAIEAMRKAGFSETDAYNFLANQQNSETPEERASKVVQSELKKYQDEQNKKLQEQEKQQLELKQKEEQATLGKFKKNISSYLGSDKDKFEFCNFYGESAEELVYETANELLKQSEEGEFEDSDSVIKVAAQEVEEYYEEMAKSMSKLKKLGYKPAEIKEMIDNPIPKQSFIKQESKQFIDTKPHVKTLTNKSILSHPNQQQELTHEQNKQNLIAKYSNLLKR